MRVFSIETLREARRRQTVEERVPYEIGGQVRYATKRIVNGEMEVYDLPRPVGEMIVTPDGLDQFVQKVVVDLELGREAVPLLYKPIYRTVTNPNFTKHVEIQGFVGRAQVVFAEHIEGEEVRFGTRRLGAKDTVPITTYAAGFEWTEDVVEYDQTWEIAELSRAMGEAYNALLNHLHLYPILSFNYPAKNKTAAVTSHGTLLENMRATLRQALIDAANDKDPETNRGRRGSILLAHPSRRWDIEEALQRMQIAGTIYPAIADIDTIILYDGWSTVVGDRAYEFPGVDPGKAYLIEPRQYAVELIKHDLRVDAIEGDKKRLMAGGMVARARRGLYIAPAKMVQEIELPS